MTKTCGGCKHYGNNSCYSTEAAFSLLDDVFRDTKACEYFECAPIVAVPTQARPENNQSSNALSMLSAETLNNLDPGNAAVRIALRMAAAAPADPVTERRRDWHRETDR